MATPPAPPAPDARVVLSSRRVYCSLRHLRTIIMTSLAPGCALMLAGAVLESAIPAQAQDRTRQERDIKVNLGLEEH